MILDVFIELVLKVDGILGSLHFEIGIELLSNYSTGVILSLGFTSKSTELLNIPELRSGPTLDPLGQGSRWWYFLKLSTFSQDQESLLQSPDQFV